MRGEVDLGITLLKRAGNPEAIAAAVQMLRDSRDPRIREVITEKYRSLNRRRDSGCFQRSALLRALRGRANAQDVELLEAALWTHEIVGEFDVATELRGAALLALNEVDERLASFHAARMLTDGHPMSGEPAVTAARLLAGQGELLPLYQAALSPDTAPEVRGECLRALVDMPASLLRRLLEQYSDSRDDATLVGLIDLLLSRPDRAAFGDFISSMLDKTQSLDLYRFAVTSIVASRDHALVDLLRQSDAASSETPKGKVLKQALRLASP
jgi:hypothetical protein